MPAVDWKVPMGTNKWADPRWPPRSEKLDDKLAKSVKVRKEVQEKRQVFLILNHSLLSWANVFSARVTVAGPENVAPPYFIHIYSTFLLFIAYLQPRSHDVMTSKEASTLERPIKSPLTSHRRLMPNRTWIRVMPVCSVHCLRPMRPTGFSDCPRRGHCFCVSGRVIRPLGFLWCFWVTMIQTTVDCLDVNTVVVLLGWKSLRPVLSNHIQRWSGQVTHVSTTRPDV